MSGSNLVDWIFTMAAIVVSWQIHAAGLRQRPSGGSSGSQPAGGGTPVSARQTGPLDEKLEHVRLAGAYAELADFLRGAVLAYEEIVAAFTSGDLQAVLPLLAPVVRKAFVQVIVERRGRGESLSTTVIGVAAEPVDAGLDGGTAWVKVRFAADLVSVLTDLEGVVIDGDPRHVVRAAEAWTFTRDVASADPNWMLSATDEDG